MLRRVNRIISQSLVTIASIALFAMMVLTAADVVGRYLFNAPITGTMELVEYMMAIIVPFSIVYCAFKGAHVSVELIVDHFPGIIRRIVIILVTVVGAVFVLLIGWQNILYICEIHSSNMTSAVLLIPVWPFVIPCALGMFAFAIILISRLFHTREE